MKIRIEDVDTDTVRLIVSALRDKREQMLASAATSPGSPCGQQAHTFAALIEQLKGYQNPRMTVEARV